MFKTEIADLNFAKEAEHQIKTTGIIHAPPEKVFDVLANEVNWYPKIYDVIWYRRDPNGVGGIRKLRFYDVSMTELYVAWEKPTTIAYTFIDISLPVCTKALEVYQLKKTEDGHTDLDWTLYYNFPNNLKWVRPPIHWFFSQTFKKAFEALKKHCEQRAP